MFIPASTRCLSTLCLAWQSAAVAKRPPHPSMARLLKYALESTKLQRTPVTDWASLRQRLGATNGAFTNWKRRGISADGAKMAQLQFGCSKDWVLEGEESGNVSPFPARPYDAESTRSAGLAQPDASSLAVYSDESALQRLGLLLDRVPDQVRITFADTLAKWALEGNKHADDRIAALLALLNQPQKQRA